jgi:EmrB/QacA subfamily drug resistance transporter
VVFTLASVLCGLAPTPAWLIAARVVQAIGGAMLTPTSLALTLAAFPQAQRAIAVTLWGAVGALAVVAGPPLGSLIVQTVGWPGIFFLNLPIGLAAVLFGSARIRESRDESGGRLPDALGIVLLIAGTALVAFGIVQSEAWGWSAPAVYGTLLGGLATLGAFILQSMRSSAPALDLSLFREANFRLGNSAMFVFSVAFTAMFFSSIQFLTRVWGYTLVQSGLALMPGPLMVVVFAPIAGRIAAARGHRILLVPGGLLYAASALFLVLSSSSTPQFLAVWLPAMIMSGIGVALVLPVLSSAAVQSLPPAKLAVGSGVNQAIRQFGSVLGVSLGFVLLGPAPDQAELFQRIFVMMSICGLGVSLLSAGIDTRPARAALEPAIM